MKPKLNFSIAVAEPEPDAAVPATDAAPRWHRRHLLLGAALAPLLGACAAPTRSAGVGAKADAAGAPASLPAAQAQLRQLEADAGGRLGIAVFAGEGAGAASIASALHYRADERFPATSTFKVLAAAAVLQQSASDKGLLQRRVMVRREDLVSYSPITGKHVGDQMTLAELCAAALQHSDNTAGNLLLRQLGGPAGLTRYARTLGDAHFRLDRWETELNTAIPGDPRDTCTPADMAHNAHRLLVGNALPSAQRTQLVEWMLANTTGDTRIRAGAPAGWKVADKTGTGDYGATNDLAVLWPPSGAPLALAVYFTQPAQDAKARSDVIAAATRIAVKAVAG